MKQRDKIFIIDGDLAAPAAFHGCVDAVSQDGLQGWLTPYFPDGAINVWIKDTLAATGKQDMPRNDISVSLNIPGCYGFHLKWDNDGLVSLRIQFERDYDLIFEFGGARFQIANCRMLSGRRLFAFARKLPESFVFRSAKNVKGAFEKLIGHPEPLSREKGDVKLIAYYLPQFHPIPENDSWWGAGFTEWTNVAQARPLFKGHYQPHIPGELGFYDLRLAETREAQANLAREHGIYGFCYYYYWFGGRRLLERPLEEMLATGKPDFPFCICWANESWTKRWDGGETDIIMPQGHNLKEDKAFIEELVPIMKDTRYIRLKGAPLLMVYRPGRLSNPLEVSEYWRDYCRNEGLGEIHLCAVEALDVACPTEIGFNSVAQLPPHGISILVENENVEGLSPSFSGKIFDYEKIAQSEMMKPDRGYKFFPGVLTSWDNTPRRGEKGDVVINRKPHMYEAWLLSAIHRARTTLPPGERLVFINAWNEWGEGAHLEPDRKEGRTILAATRRAITGQSGWRELLDSVDVEGNIAGVIREEFVKELRACFERMQLQLSWYEELYAKGLVAKSWTPFKPGKPLPMNLASTNIAGKLHIDQINYVMQPSYASVERESKMLCSGWNYTNGYSLTPNTPTYLLLLAEDSDEILYHGFVYRRSERRDVASSLPNNSGQLYSGFYHLFDMTRVLSGIYRLGILTYWPGVCVLASGDVRLEVE